MTPLLLPALTPPASRPAQQPSVFVDGQRAADLSCVRFAAHGRLDRRTAVLEASPTITPADLDRYRRSAIVIAHELRYADGTPLTLPLMRGRVVAVDESISRLSLQLSDDLFPRLERRAALPDEPLTVAEAIEQLAAHARCGLDLTLLPDALRIIPLTCRLTRERGIADHLDTLFARHALQLRRSWRKVGNRYEERFAVVPDRSARLVTPLHPATPGRSLLGRDDERDAAALRILALRAVGREIESTFELVPAWDPAREGADPSRYGYRHAEFDYYADVYRKWVLNEDGFYCRPPFGRAAFDLGAFLDRPGLAGQPIPLGRCLVLDYDGARRAAVVHVSLDTGQTWQLYRGQRRVLSDRAGVRFIDEQLDSALLAAALAGAMRVRITATLRNPGHESVAVARGGAFARAAPSEVVSAGASFVFRRVAEDSIHHQPIQWGTLEAAEADDGARMAFAAQHMHASPRPARPTLRLHGDWSHLAPGDRVAPGDGRLVARRIHSIETHYHTRGEAAFTSDLTF